MKVYLAAQYSRRREMLLHSMDLRALGHEITSTWIYRGERDAQDNGRQIAEGSDQALWAMENLLDVLDAEVLIAFTEPPETLSRGNRHVEFGIALGNGKKCIVVGPRELVFHHYEAVQQYDTWREALKQFYSGLLVAK